MRMISTEQKILSQLKSKDKGVRYKALLTLSKFGGPGAVPLLSHILEGKSSAKEKIKAARVIWRIAYRTGIYYEGISALDRIYEHDPRQSVQMAARHARERIAGFCLIRIFPGCKIDNRILASPNEVRSPDSDF